MQDLSSTSRVLYNGSVYKTYKKKSAWHKEVQKDLEQIPNINQETIMDNNKYRKIKEEFKLEEKINRQGEVKSQKKRERSEVKEWKSTRMKAILKEKEQNGQCCQKWP